MDEVQVVGHPLHAGGGHRRDQLLRDALAREVEVGRLRLGVLQDGVLEVHDPPLAGRVPLVTDHSQVSRRDGGQAAQPTVVALGLDEQHEGPGVVDEGEAAGVELVAADRCLHELLGIAEQGGRDLLPEAVRRSAGDAPDATRGAGRGGRSGRAEDCEQVASLLPKTPEIVVADGVEVVDLANAAAVEGAVAAERLDAVTVQVDVLDVEVWRSANPDAGSS